MFSYEDDVSGDNTMHDDVFSLESDYTIFVAQNRKFSFKSIDLKNARVTDETTQKNEKLIDFGNYELLRKYFYKWKENIKKTDLVINMARVQETKINEFVNIIKSQQQYLRSNTELIRRKSSKAAKPSENFENRYEVQSYIIDRQKQKIERQNRIIDELKLGIIREDLLKSIENKNYVIREIFGNCSEKLVNEAPFIKDMEERKKIMVSAQKAPTLLKIQQQRAIERKKYREEIIERKKYKEEQRQALLEEIIKKKKSLEEEERKRHLEIISEQRKRELKLQQIRQQKKQQFEKKNLRAVNFHNRLMIKQCFKTLFNIYNKTRENIALAITVCLRRQKLKIFRAWLGLVEANYSIKYDIADAHFNYKILKGCVIKWKEFVLECVRSMQVAEDLYDLRLTSNTFVNWHRYVCKEIMIQYSKSQVAAKHNNRRLLFQSFYQWRYLPAVIQLEKSKEETKRKWRAKVWEILPDYQPPEL